MDINECMLPTHFLPEGRKNFEWTGEDAKVEHLQYSLNSQEYTPNASSLDKTARANSTITYTIADFEGSKESDDLHVFLRAAEDGDLLTVEALLGRCTSLLNAKDKDGYTGTHRACYSGHQNVLACLIGRGCNIRVRTNDGWEPIHCAVRWNHLEICEALLKSGADINAKTNGGQTPLHLAAVSPSHTAILEMLLLNPEIDGSIVNGAGDTAEDIARRSGPHMKLFQMIDKSLTI